MISYAVKACYTLSETVQNFISIIIIVIVYVRSKRRLKNNLFALILSTTNTK